jgi:hypothetical protein
MDRLFRLAASNFLIYRRQRVRSDHSEVKADDKNGVSRRQGFEGPVNEPAIPSD